MWAWFSNYMTSGERFYYLSTVILASLITTTWVGVRVLSLFFSNEVDKRWHLSSNSLSLRVCYSDEVVVL